MTRLTMPALMALTIVLTGCNNLRTHVEYETLAPQSFPVLTATGMAPLSLQQGKTDQERMRQAMRAATLDAYRELAEQVHGVQISGSAALNQQMLSDERFQAQVDGLIRGAKVVRAYAVDDTYIAELELDYQRVWQLYQQQPRTKIKKVTYY